MRLDTENVGADTEVMAEICTELERESQTLISFVDDLGNLEKDLSNYWEGNDMETLHAEFANFRKSLEEMPEVISSIAKWGQSTSNEYDRVMSKTITSINEIFNA